jgi:hypothetical protein
VAPGDRFKVFGVSSGEFAYRNIGCADRERAAVMVLEVMPEAAEQDGLQALRLGSLVEHPERRPHMPHFVADDVADDRGHFDNAEEFRPSRSVFMVTMTGRFVPAIAMITGSVEARHRGGFMSLNSCVQQTFSGLGTSFGGYLIIDQVRQPLQNYGLIGWIAAGIAIACIGLAARLRRPPASPSSPDAATAEIMG